MVTCGVDGTVKVFDARTYKKLRSFSSKGAVVKSLDISQKGLLSVAYDNIVNV